MVDFLLGKLVGKYTHSSPRDANAHRVFLVWCGNHTRLSPNPGDQVLPGRPFQSPVFSGARNNSTKKGITLDIQIHVFARCERGMFFGVQIP